ncbi:hypothetical protein AB0F17_19045 [Nonomuraea sp. NPDC026600]|uniref:hypothetical protein n=1 Tax=Nonomuraea sp. NPDC026600 TaxID=3155363 RepID=UPI003402DE37
MTDELADVIASLTDSLQYLGWARRSGPVGEARRECLHQAARIADELLGRRVVARLTRYGFMVEMYADPTANAERGCAHDDLVDRVIAIIDALHDRASVTLPADNAAELALIRRAGRAVSDQLGGIRVTCQPIRGHAVVVTAHERPGKTEDPVFDWELGWRGSERERD